MSLTAAATSQLATGTAPPVHSGGDKAAPALEITELVYSRNRHTAPILNGVSLSLGHSKILCLLGPNGIGKTTLLHCLIGVLQPQEGSILINGKQGLPPSELAKQLAYVPQGAGNNAMNLFDIALMGRAPHLPLLAMPAKRDKDIAYAALEQVGIAHLAMQPLNQVSGGERQLAFIARALAQQSRLFIMDEPTASLDLGNQARVLRTIIELAAAGKSVLITTHQPEHALLLNADVAALSGGHISVYGAARQVLQPSVLSELYATPIDLVHHQGSPVSCIPRL